MKEAHAEKFKKVGIKIVSYRLMRDMTQKELAAALDMEPHHVSRMEKGRVGLSLSRIFDIADALNIEPHLLLDFSDLTVNSK